MSASQVKKSLKPLPWVRGDIIDGTSIRFLKDLGTDGSKHARRMFIGQCTRCDTIKPFRADAVKKGETKTCGCGLQELISSGKLTGYSVRSRKEKLITVRAGRTFKDGVFLFIPDKYKHLFRDVTIGDLDFMGEE
jgi:hypothetical protein